MGYDQLSFLSYEDQAKFTQLFEHATNTTSISPNAARNILLKSNLGPHQLAKIWELSDINKTGDLLFPEFALALHLCNVCLRGEELPYELAPQIKDEVTKLVDKINFSVPENEPQFQPQQFQPPSLQRSTTTDILESQTLQQQQSLLLQNQATGFGFQNSPAGGQQFPQNPSAATFNTGNAPPLQLNYQVTGLQPQGFQQQQQHVSTPESQHQFGVPTQATGFKQGLKPQQTSNANAFISSQSPSQSHNLFENSGFPSQPPAGLVQSQQTSSASLNAQPANSLPVLQPQQTMSGTFPQPSVGLAQQPTSLVQEATEFAPLNTQRTGGLVPLNSAQQTGGVLPLNSQQTGGLVPVKTQQSLAPQQTSTGTVPQPSLVQQPTGLVPLNSQPTGLTQQPTGLIAINIQKTDSNSQGLQPQVTGLIPLPKQQTGYQLPQETGALQQPMRPGHTGGAGLLLHESTNNSSLPPLQSQKTGVGNFEPLRQQKTGIGQNSFFLSNLIQQQEQQQQNQFFDTVSMYNDQSITYQEKQLFNKIFDNYDVNKKGTIKADVSAEIFRKSGLNRQELEKIWDLITRPNQSSLDKESFQLGMWLVYKRLNGFPIPEYLPDSLKPSSLKILDDVKNKLKQNNTVKTVKKSSYSKIDGSRFKNNDDELVVSSSRHRRRKTTDFNNSSNSTSSADTTSSTASITTEKLSFDELKKLIWEKKILLEAMEQDAEVIEDHLKIGEAEDLQVIESLKEQIKNLPLYSNRTSQGNRGLDQLTAKLHSLTTKVPNLMNEISVVNTQIKNLKLELYKTQHPSVVVGTGPNGEITDMDRRKLKSKQLLAVKMAKLTGKALDPEIANFNAEEEKLNEEVLKIQKENEDNQKVIKDVEHSITELSNSINSSLTKNGSNRNSEEYRKWELGVGLQPEVQELVKSFKVDDISQRFTSSLSLKDSSSYPQTHQPQSGTPAQVSSTPSPTLKSVSSFQSSEERRAYIKEQARKRMTERMAKFGIRSQNSPSTSRSSSPAIHAPASNPHLVPSTIETVNASETQESSSDDDEEEFERMEEIRRLKRLERDARLVQDSQSPEPSKIKTPDASVEVSTFHKSNPFAAK